VRAVKRVSSSHQRRQYRHSDRTGTAAHATSAGEDEEDKVKVARTPPAGASPHLVNPVSHSSNTGKLAGGVVLGAHRKHG
jgi:hypothetical protein